MKQASFIQWKRVGNLPWLSPSSSWYRLESGSGLTKLTPLPQGRAQLSNPISSSRMGCKPSWVYQASGTLTGRFCLREWLSFLLLYLKQEMLFLRSLVHKTAPLWEKSTLICFLWDGLALLLLGGCWPPMKSIWTIQFTDKYWRKRQPGKLGKSIQSKPEVGFTLGPKKRNLGEL